MAFLSVPPSKSGKTSNATLYSISTLKDKIIANAMVNGHAFTRVTGRQYCEASNSPYIYIGDRGNTFTTIDYSAGTLTEGEAASNDRNFVRICIGEGDTHFKFEPFESPEGSLILLDRDSFLAISRQMNMFTSDGKLFLPFKFTSDYDLLKSQLDSSDQRGVAVAFVGQDSTVQCAAFISFEGTECFIRRALISVDYLTSNRQIFQGFPFIYIEGIAEVPSSYVRFSASASGGSTDDKIISTLEAILIRRAKSIIGSNLTGVKIDLDSVSPEIIAKIDSLWPSSVHGDSFILIPGDDVDVVKKQLGGIKARVMNLDDSIFKAGLMRTSTLIDLLAAIDSSFRDLYQNYLAIRDRYYNYNIDPLNLAISPDTLVWVDDNGQPKTSRSTFFNRLMDIPGFMWIDSLVSEVYTSGGSALSGGLSSDFLKSLYGCNHNHAILCYPSPEGGEWGEVLKDKNDILLRYDVSALQTGNFIPGPVVNRANNPTLRAYLAMTSRVISQRSKTVKFAEYDPINDVVKFFIPKEVSERNSDLRITINNKTLQR